MKIELKNVKHAAFASQETHCFSATVYIDGVKAGTASNDGHGGADRYDPWSLGDRLNAYAKTLPPVDVSDMYSDGQKHEMTQTGEMIIGELVNDFLRKRDLKRLCSGKTVCRLPGQTYKDGEYSVFKAKYTPELKAKLIAKYGEPIEFLNDQIA